MITLAVITISIYMSCWFVIGQALRRNDVADIAWGLGFVTLAWVLYFNRPSIQLSLATILVTVWGIRLAIHIFLRNRKKPEDFRYQQWRKDWGKWFLVRSFIQVYLLQGLLLLCISAPLIVLSRHGLDTLLLLNVIAVPLWVTGFIFESVGDYQLGQFIQAKHPKGAILQTGLWRYTRHPNYFGEVLQWWAIWLIAYGATGFWWALLGPLTITILILKVSGIPLLEKRYKDDVAYQEYARRTSKFFPLPVRKGL